MTTYFISTTGNDSNSGSQGSPFLTFKKSLETMVAGDLLLVRGGTYNQSIRKFEINIPSGTSYTNAITVRNFTGESPIIAPGNGTLLDLNYSSSGSLHYLILDGIVFDGQFTNESIFFDGVTVDHLRFINVTIRNSLHQGISGFDGSNSIEIIGCDIHNNGTNPHFDHGIYIATPNLLVDGCDIHNNLAYGIQIYHSGAGATLTNGTVIRNSSIHNNGEGGNTLNHGNGLDFYNNTVYNNVANGVDISYNNANFRVYNNTIYGNGGSPVAIGDAQAQNAVIDNNIFWQNGINNITSNGGTFTQSNNLTSNPIFVNQGSFDFHLQSNSPAIRGGTSSLYPATDKDGSLRTTPPDIGAYQFLVVILPPPSTTITCDDSLPWILVSSGTFASDTLLKTVNFSVRPARWICLRSLREINGNPWTSCTEFMGVMNGLSLLQTKGILLLWDHALITEPPTDAAVAFRIYRQDTPTGLFTLIATVPYPIVSYLDTTVIAGSSYSYEITAVDYFNNESSISNIVSGVAPSALQHSVWCFDSQELGVNNGAVNAIDGLTTTFWHTQWMTASPPQPHNIVVDLGTVYPLNGFQYLPRQDGTPNGTIIQYEFYICDYFISKGRVMNAPIMQPILAM